MNKFNVVTMVAVLMLVTVFNSSSSFAEVNSRWICNSPNTCESIQTIKGEKMKVTITKSETGNLHYNIETQCYVTDGNGVQGALIPNQFQSAYWDQGAESFMVKTCSGWPVPVPQKPAIESEIQLPDEGELITALTQS